MGFGFRRVHAALAVALEVHRDELKTDGLQSASHLGAAGRIEQTGDVLPASFDTGDIAMTAHTGDNKNELAQTVFGRFDARQEGAVHTAGKTPAPGEAAVSVDRAVSRPWIPIDFPSNQHHK